MKKRDENSQLEMLEGAKSIGAGAATIASAIILCIKPLKAMFSGAAEPIPGRVSEYVEELGIHNVHSLAPEQRLQEIAALLELRCFNMGIETLPVGHSWEEIAQQAILRIYPHLTDDLGLSYVEALLSSGGPGGDLFINKALRLLLEGHLL